MTRWAVIGLYLTCQSPRESSRQKIDITPSGLRTSWDHAACLQEASQRGDCSSENIMTSWGQSTTRKQLWKFFWTYLLHLIQLFTKSFYKGFNGTSRLMTLEWFRSYLHCRRPAVNINGTVSDEASLTYNVPQGSVLGPILFTLYTSPLGNVARQHGLQVHFYADVTQLYVTFDPRVATDEKAIAARMTSCLDNIRQGMVKNFMKLNDDKTEYLNISSPNMRNKISSMDLQVGNVSVSSTVSTRNIGVCFDQSMKVDRHISQVCQTAYFQLRNIAVIRPLLTRMAAESLIHSLISSWLDFCKSLLAGLPSATLTRLQAVQNAAARLLTGLRKHDHISPVLGELHWLPVKSRIEFKVLLLTFKAIHGQTPGYVSSLIERPHLRPSLRSFRVRRVRRGAGGLGVEPPSPQFFFGAEGWPKKWPYPPPPLTEWNIGRNFLDQNKNVLLPPPPPRIIRILVQESMIFRYKRLLQVSFK